MDPGSYNDVSKSNPSAFYGALSGSVCFPMPLMYNPMNSYPFMSTPFLPMHHPMLSGHSIQDSAHLLSEKTEELGSRALAFIQSRYQSMGKCFLPPPPRKSMGKYCSPLMDNEPSKLNTGTYNLVQSSDSNGNVIPTSLSSIASPTSGSYPDKECYLSSPGTEIEEPDSSGKCSTDVVEQKVIPRWTCDSSQPPICPICGRTLALQDLTDHYHMELDRLGELMKRKDWLSQEENTTDQLDTLRIQTYHDVEKRCPEFRKETYLRVRANRINRLGGCGPKPKRQCFEDPKQSWKMQRTNVLCSPKQENLTEEHMTQSSQQSMLMLELTVQQLAHRAEGRTDLTTENYNQEKRNISLFPNTATPTSEGYHEDQNKTGELADSSCNSFNNNSEVGACQSSGFDDTSRRQRSDSRSDDNPCSSVDIKCMVCMESYKKPVVSVCCWHVHCESCWLKSLGNKRVCPQCETITSPGDLRRIHL